MRPLVDVVDEGSHSFTPAGHLLEHHRAARFMKAEGYRFHFFPSAIYGPTQHNSDADVEHEPQPGFNLSRVVNRSNYFMVYFDRTLLGLTKPYLEPYNVTHIDHIRRTLDGVAALAARADRQTPVFAVAHVLMPHPPAYVDSTCGPRRPEAPEVTRYQVNCINRWTLAMVRSILARSDPKPIIVLQGDHGTKRLGLFASQTTLPGPDQIAERYRTFGAYYLPDGGAAVMPYSVTVANVLRYVFGYYFNADLPPLPNKLYYSHWMLPYKMHEIGSGFRILDPARTEATLRRQGRDMGQEW
jgi:hypothetical protein